MEGAPAWLAGEEDLQEEEHADSGEENLEAAAEAAEINSSEELAAIVLGQHTAVEAAEINTGTKQEALARTHELPQAAEAASGDEEEDELEGQLRVSESEEARHLQFLQETRQAMETAGEGIVATVIRKRLTVLVRS